MTNPTNYVERDFPNFGVKVLAPSAVNVILSRIDSNPAYEAAQSNFTFIRLIGNLKFEANGRTDFTFDPAARLQVTVPDDLRPQRRGLKIAWWNGSSWVPLTDMPNGPDEDSGNMVVGITTISDPPISWGR
jgi:hypothetical protein